MENFNKYILFLGFLLLVGCSPIYHKCGAPDKIISIEPQLIDYLNKHNEIQNVVRKYCLIVNPIITNKNSIGIYSLHILSLITLGIIYLCMMVKISILQILMIAWECVLF